MKLIVASAAAKALRKQVPAPIAANISARMQAIAADPYAPHGSVTALQGGHGRFRLRVGEWRALYTVDQAAQTVTVNDVRLREDAYR